MMMTITNMKMSINKWNRWVNNEQKWWEKRGMGVCWTERWDDLVGERVEWI